MNDTGDLLDRQRVGLGIAILRVALIPLLIVGERTSESKTHTTAFWVLVGMATAYAIGVLVARIAERRSGRDRLPERVDSIEAAVDFGLLCGLTFTSGGAFSELSKAFFVLPVIAAMRLRPRLTAAWALLAVVGFVGSALLHEGIHGPEEDTPEELLTEALYLAWIGLGAILLSDVLARRRERIESLAAERGRLAAQALAAEERERGRLAQVLHDEAVQNLLHARQELAEAQRGDPDALGRAEQAVAMTIERLRGEIRETHPSVLDHAGLAAAVQALADEHERRGAPPIEVDVDPAVAGRQDRLVHSLARELLANAVRHAEASRIELRLRDEAGGIVLEVCDDGLGIPPGRVERMVRDGHIGLASWSERVAAIGGSLAIESPPGGGALVRATLPPAPLP